MKKYRLPKEFTEQWLEALRSGEYNQAKGILYNSCNNGYCCLGVAMKMQGVSNSELEGCGVLVDSAHGFRKTQSKYVPKELYGTMRNRLIEVLTRMNDDGHSFEQIADWIEENIETY